MKLVFSSLCSWTVLCCCWTVIFFRYFSFSSTSICLSTSSLRKFFSSLLRDKNTCRFLSSSDFYSVCMILVISLTLFTSSLFWSSSDTNWSLSADLYASFYSLKSFTPSLRAILRLYFSRLKASWWSFLASKRLSSTFFWPPLIRLSNSSSIIFMSSSVEEPRFKDLVDKEKGLKVRWRANV